MDALEKICNYFFLGWQGMRIKCTLIEKRKDYSKKIKQLRERERFWDTSFVSGKAIKSFLILTLLYATNYWNFNIEPRIVHLKSKFCYLRNGEKNYFYFEQWYTLKNHLYYSHLSDRVEW